ncbi:MAG: ABC-2 transporter permease [Chloroflexi bacterium]|nr:ABC-2 transporter permease [Chloroflexota bacterium]
MTEAQGEVFDLGYRRYEGPREGRMRARKALWVNGVRTALGIGRPLGAKVIPAFLFIAVMIPAVIVSMVATQPNVDVIRHDGYYQIVSMILILFSAIIAPELLCPDRRDGVISLYLVRPMTTTDYVAARWMAFLTVTLGIVLAGQIVLFVGLVLAATEPLEYMKDNWLDVPRFMLAGLVVAAFTTAIPLAVSAFTTRRAYATSIIMGLFIISLPVAGILSLCGEDETVAVQGGKETVVTQKCEPATGDAAKWYALLAVGQVPSFVNDLIFPGQTDEGIFKEFSLVVAELPDAVPIGWYLILTIGPGLALLWRYRRISV